MTAGKGYGFQRRKKRAINPAVCIAHRRRAGLPARPERKSLKFIANQPGERGRVVRSCFLPVILVPRGAWTINARMALGGSVRLAALTNYGDPVAQPGRDYQTEAVEGHR
jgi:hypothetical protein